MKSIIVRAIQHADRQSWAQMRRQLWCDLTVEQHLAEIDTQLKQPRYAAYLAINDKAQALGFAELSIRDYANGCTELPVPFLEGIWVTPSYRGQGVGRLLITQISRDLISQGFHELCSDAEISNIRSHQAHSQWGFSETERVIYFRKPLS